MYQTQRRPAPAVVNGTLSLAETETRDPLQGVLVKFNFGEKYLDLIPAGVPQVDRESDGMMDVYHQIAALQAGLDQSLTRLGRVRPGRVDTGTNVLAVNWPVHAAILRRGLANNGFRLVGIHWFSRDKDERRTYVLNAAYIRSGRGIELTDSVTQALRDLANMTWGQCFVWDNPPGNPATVNFVDVQRRQKPKFALAVRDGQVAALEAVEYLPEEQE